MTAIALNKRNILIQGLRTVLTITAMALLPILVHLIPFSGKTPLGAYLLPMFIAPLVSAFYLSPAGLVAACLIGPPLNYVLTGMPDLTVLPTLIPELTIFSLIILWMIRNKASFIGISTLAFVSAKFVSFAIKSIFLAKGFSLIMFGAFITGLATSLPGLLILFILERVLISKTSENGQS